MKSSNNSSPLPGQIRTCRILSDGIHTTQQARPELRSEQDRNPEISFLISENDEPPLKRRKLTDDETWSLLTSGIDASSLSAPSAPVLNPYSPPRHTTHVVSNHLDDPARELESSIIAPAPTPEPVAILRTYSAFKSEDELLHQLQEWGDAAAKNLKSRINELTPDFRKKLDKHLRKQIGPKIVEQPIREIINLLSQFVNLARERKLPAPLLNTEESIISHGVQVVVDVRKHLMNPGRNKQMDKSHDVVAATCGVALSATPALYNALEDLGWLGSMGLKGDEKLAIIQRAFKGESISDEDIWNVCAVPPKKQSRRKKEPPQKNVGPDKDLKFPPTPRKYAPYPHNESGVHAEYGTHRDVATSVLVAEYKQKS